MMHLNARKSRTTCQSVLKKKEKFLVIAGNILFHHDCLVSSGVSISSHFNPNQTGAAAVIKSCCSMVKWQAPSGVNTQPWQVAVVMGERKKLLEQRLENAYRSGIKGQMDYQYYPCEWHEPYKTRRNVFSFSHSAVRAGGFLCRQFFQKV